MTTLENVKKQMHTLKAKKQSDLSEIRQKSEAAVKQRKEAVAAIEKAAERLNIEEYEQAKQAEHKAQTLIDLLGKRFIQIQQEKLIPENESDAVIDSLLKYESDLESGLTEAVKEPLNRLNELVNNYLSEVKETEECIKDWTTDIHKNYRSATATYRDGTNRSATPLPVHPKPFLGCKLSEVLSDSLKQIFIILGA